MWRNQSSFLNRLLIFRWFFVVFCRICRFFSVAPILYLGYTSQFCLFLSNFGPYFRIVLYHFRGPEMSDYFILWVTSCDSSKWVLAFFTLLKSELTISGRGASMSPYYSLPLMRVDARFAALLRLRDSSCGARARASPFSSPQRSVHLCWSPGSPLFWWKVKISQ